MEWSLEVILGVDKLYHLGLSFFICLCLYPIFSEILNFSVKLSIFCLLLLFVPISFIKEYMDSFEQYNFFNFFDIFANYFGVILFSYWIILFNPKSKIQD